MPSILIMNRLLFLVYFAYTKPLSQGAFLPILVFAFPRPLPAPYAWTSMACPLSSQTVLSGSGQAIPACPCRDCCKPCLALPHPCPPHLCKSSARARAHTRPRRL